MYSTASPSPAVAVGIDGSRWSVDAALWAVDEAVSRDVPLRLLYVVEPRPHTTFDPQQAARDLACAEVSVRQTLVAVESAEKPVKIEWEVLQGDPTRVLLNAARSADLMCIGSLGIAHATGQRPGSTAAALATSAQCPVAIVRSTQHWSTRPRQVVVEIDESPDSVYVLDAGIGEARLRGAPLTVLATWQSELDDVRETTADENVRAQLDKRLARYRQANPDIEFNTVAARGSTMNYLAHQSDSVQMVVVGQNRRRGLGEIVGSAQTTPHRIDCSVLICRHHHRL
ncbi:universal stress protein [Mycobacterium sp. OTB74]|uniref:universal stress protein n=1 Tax=Mycobacterium sp. OTB74 TaxID=1853452 RepID=UPI002476AFB4|nr:universal stress protein [Mycobacterium sp. OTB74]MDH6246977.1 nucleotide-binding universal stress UspA family protein [Mycobacterium sp. OTB74]